jgi:RND family efflux transporter MFP subunit
MRVTGNLRSHSIAEVASQVAGRVEKVFVWQGDDVEEGALLVTLDTRRVRKAIDVLKARKNVQISIRAIRTTELKDAEADVQAYLRARESREGVVSDQTLRTARTKAEVIRGRIAQVDAEIASIQAEIDEQQIQLDDAVVVAPFKGVVLERHAEEGEWLDTGESVARLMEMGELEAVLDVSERVPMHVLKALEHLSVTIGALDLTVDSLSHRILPNVEPRSRRYSVIARLPEHEQLAPGMSIYAYLPTNEMVLRTLVSSDALQRDQSGFFVYKVAPIDGELKAVPVGVMVDFSTGHRVAVTARDLKEGDLIVREGNVRLRPMQAIHVKDLATVMPGLVGALKAQQAENAKRAKRPGGDL